MHFNKRSIISNCKNMKYIFDIIKLLSSQISIIARFFLLSFDKDFEITNIE